MNLSEKLANYKKKTITKQELEKVCGVFDDEILYNIIKDNPDILSPIVNSKTNGNRRFPIYLKYHVVTTKENNDEAFEAIKGLHPKLLRNKWLLSHPDEYLKNQFVLEHLNDFMFCNHSTEYISRKERSFMLFDEEKLLDGNDIKSLLTHLEITKEDLRMYDTPEYCFNDYIPDRKEKLILLICENKDIWFNIRRLMFEEDKFSFFDKPIDGVVYGGGNKVTSTNALTEYVGFMKSKVSFLYWGDIDRAGLDIFVRARKANPQLHIDLFFPGYRKMLELANGRAIPDSEDARSIKTDFSEIYEMFDDCADELRFYIESYKRLPQEIITYEVLKNNSKE